MFIFVYRKNQYKLTMETFRKIVTAFCLIFAAMALFFLVTSRFVEALVALFIGGVLHVIAVITKKDGYGSYHNDGL